jgi:hypothetical protein
MYPNASAAMWTDAKLTKSQKISSHLLDCIKRPITAKELDIDALAGKNHDKRKHDSYQMMSQSKDNIK